MGNGLANIRMQRCAAAKQLFNQASQLSRTLRIQPLHGQFTGLRRAGQKRYFQSGGIEVFAKDGRINISADWHVGVSRMQAMVER